MGATVDVGDAVVGGGVVVVAGRLEVETTASVRVGSVSTGAVEPLESGRVTSNAITAISSTDTTDSATISPVFGRPRVGTAGAAPAATPGAIGGGGGGGARAWPQLPQKTASSSTAARQD